MKTTCRFQCECKFSTMGKCQGGQLLGHIIRGSFVKPVKLTSVHFALLPAMNEGFCCPPSSPVSGVSVLDFGYWMCSYLSVDLFCISPVTQDVEHLFLCLFAICIFPLVKCLLRFQVHFRIRLFVFFLLSFKSSLYLQDTSSLSDVSFANISSQYVICLFHSLDIVLYREENFNFNDVQFINNFLHGSCLWC